MSDYQPLTVSARIADLGFSCEIHKDFRLLELPEETPDFSNPTVCVALAAIMASYGAVVFAVAARPAFEDGTVQDWLLYFTEHNGMKLRSFEPGMIGPHPVMVGDSTQASEAGTMVQRVAAMEDGGRLVLLTIMAPGAIWPSVQPTLRAMMESFVLTSPKGVTTPLLPSQPRDLKILAASRAVDVALAEDAASLDPEHPTNASLRDRGVGLTVRVLEVNAAEKYAVVGAGAIAALVRVPLGWHCIDDGKRTLVFDPANAIQISMNLRTHEGTVQDALVRLLDGARREQADVEEMFVDAMGYRILVLKNVKVGSEVLMQAYVARDVGRAGMIVVARVTATQAEMARALNVAEVLVTHLKVPV